MKSLLRKLFNKTPAAPLVSDVIEETVPYDPAPRFVDFHIKDCPENIPTFKREYRATIADDVTVRIDIENGRYQCDKERKVSGVLSQTGRGYVFFDACDLADKIIIPEIVAATQSLMTHVLELDAEFAKTQDRFTDKDGQVWLRLGREN